MRLANTFFAGCAAAALAGLLGLANSVAHGQEWGNLSGHFIFDGKAPAPVKLDINKDQDFCGKPPALVDESLVVNDKGEVANVVVWVRTPKDIKAHPDYAALLKEKAVIDNSHCNFDPHIIVCRIGQPLEIKNADTVAHNTAAQLQTNDAFNFQLPAMNSQEMKPLKNAEPVPASVNCNIHGWMKGWLVVPPTPYVAVSDKEGKFEIKNLPVGKEIEFQVWQEKKGYLDKANIGGKDAGWTKGRFKMTIKPGNNDLGDIKVSI
jgi:hypothetical protein